MNESLLEIRQFTGEGYQPVIDFGSWRVAILNYLDEIHPEKIDFVERHNETDEVFVLLRGQAVLFLGEGEAQLERLHSVVMESGKIYNVKRGAWHTIVLSRDGSVLLVENRNTARENSSYLTLTPEYRRKVVEKARLEQPDWR
jgi:ureidoglycolate hydrolase